MTATPLVWIAVALAGGLGAILRFELDGAVQGRLAGEFPFGTLTVNGLGSFLLGLLHGAGVTGDQLLLAGVALLGSYDVLHLDAGDRAPGRGRRSRAWRSRTWPRVWRSASQLLHSAGPLGRQCDQRLPQAHRVLRRARPRQRAPTLDLLVDLYERHGLAAAILVRGTEGFGIKHRLHTQRMLTLSEDLPLVSIALDARSG